MKKRTLIQRLEILFCVCVLLAGLSACGKEEKVPSLSDFAGYWSLTIDEQDFILVIEGEEWVEYEPDGNVGLQGTLADNGDGTLTLNEAEGWEYGKASLSTDESMMTVTQPDDTEYEYSKTDKSALE